MHPRNPDVYELKHLEHPDKEPTRHHVRELCPYISKAAHSKSQPVEAVNGPVSELDPKVGDYLLLPYGKADYVVKVIAYTHGIVRFHYLNQENPATNSHTALRLVWVKQSISGNNFNEGAVDERTEIYADKLTNKQMADGFQPFEDTVSIDEFYQKLIEPSYLKKTATGLSLNKLKRTLIRRHKPQHQK